MCVLCWVLMPRPPTHSDRLGLTFRASALASAARSSFSSLCRKQFICQRAGHAHAAHLSNMCHTPESAGCPEPLEGLSRRIPVSPPSPAASPCLARRVGRLLPPPRYSLKEEKKMLRMFLSGTLGNILLLPDLPVVSIVLLTESRHLIPLNAHLLA